MRLGRLFDCCSIYHANNTFNIILEACKGQAVKIKFCIDPYRCIGLSLEKSFRRKTEQTNRPASYVLSNNKSTNLFIL